jgi:hypothetical protein
VDELVEKFEQNRAQLRAVAYRMLGSVSEAEDAVTSPSTTAGSPRSTSSPTPPAAETSPSPPETQAERTAAEFCSEQVLVSWFS